MSSFFTTPASQRKRKRDTLDASSSTKRRNTSTSTSTKSTKAKPARARRDESISSEQSEEESRHKGASDVDSALESDSGDEQEAPADRRLRLAEQYLQKIKDEAGDEIGFDAEEIDRDLIAERLQSDVAETKGRLHRNIADSLDFSGATMTRFRYSSLTTTSIATCAPYAYTVSKDLLLIKWELPNPAPPPSEDPVHPKRPPRPYRRRPIRILTARGNKRKHGDSTYQYHTAPILCVAASSTGKFVATGGADRRLIIWSATDLKPLRVFTQHRDAVTSLAFRKGTNQLYSSSKDRTIKSWSLDELAYVESLFGHQDEVVDIAALSMERCVSVGARDRTARLWKVVEETQLVFRGGGSSDKKRPGKDALNTAPRSYNEGSIDRVALVDEETFVTGSDNGSLSLWSLQKKKPVFTVPLAHGLDPAMKPEEVSADRIPSVKVPEQQPRWITALATVPLADLVLSGSWDGSVRAWRVSGDRKSLERVGAVGCLGENERGDHEGAAGQEIGDKEQSLLPGFINDLSVFERGNRGSDGLSILVAFGSEPRLGRWKTLKSKSGAVVFEVARKATKTESKQAGND